MTTPYAIARLEERVEDVLADHGAGRATIDLAPYRGRPVAFAEDLLGVTLYDRQRELLQALVKHKYTAARGNHGAGKDFLLAIALLYMALVEGKLCLAISATERQLLGQLWAEVRRRFVSSNLPGTLYASSLEVGGVRRIVAMTSGSVSNLTGWHDARGVFVAITEGQGDAVEANAYDAAIANAVDDKSVVCVVGNPIKPSGRFFEISRKAHWHTITFSAFDHPNVREGREVIPGGPSAQWVEEVAREYGRDSAYFTARVLGEFPTAGAEDALIGRAEVDAAFGRWKSGALAMQANNCQRYVVADIARGGADSTCIAVMRGPIIESLTTFHEPDLMKTAKYLHERAIALGRDSVPFARATERDIFNGRCWIICDDAGLGGGITDRLRELRAAVLPFNGAEKARNSERFANRRAEAYFDLRERLLRGRIAVPPDEKLAEELLATTYSTNGAGKIIICPKDEIKSRIGRSPDRADCLSMAAESRGFTRIGSYIA